MKNMMVGVLAGLVCFGALRGAEKVDYTRSVVLIESVHKAAGYEEPWQMQPHSTSRGSGFLVAGGKILTNAHVVADQVMTTVRRVDMSEQFSARVLFVDYDRDLALLEVADSRFLSGLVPLELGGMPRVGSAVDIVGFQDGLEKIAITRGTVSRYESILFRGQKAAITLNVDASARPGNSGGPLMQGGRAVGIVFAGYGSIAYVVPVERVSQWMADTGDGRIDGVPDVGVETQKVESVAMKECLGLGPTGGGVYVTAVEYGTSAWGVLREGDVIRAIDGQPVEADGTYISEFGDRFDYRYLFGRRQVGETASLEVLRAGQSLTLSMPIKPRRTLVPGNLHDVRATYLVYGGLLFQPLNENYLGTWSEWKYVPPELESLYFYGKVREGRREVILLTKILPHEVNRGYSIANEVVEEVNGKPIGSMQDLVLAIDSHPGPFQRFRFSNGTLVVIDARKVNMAQAEILKNYQIPADRSQDLLPATQTPQAEPGGVRPDGRTRP